MVNTDKLRGIMAERRKTQTDMARVIGISPKTFYTRMKKKEFGSDEIEIMIKELDITNPMEIFFAK